MEIDQTNYVQKVIEIEVKGKFGPMIRLRIKGADEGGSSLSFSIWADFNVDALERLPVEIVIRELDESQPAEPELVDEEPDV